MDDIVRQAMAKWPNVPDCYGWLGLDARGNWYMRDDSAQAAGRFSDGTKGSKGSLLQHEKLIDFIARNYAADDRGCWFFQNGPQRVFVELQATPWIWRLNPDHSVTSHTGVRSVVERCLLDESGKVYLQTVLGIGLVHTLDVGWVADAVESGKWTIENASSERLPAIYMYVKSPTTLQKM
jgi:hypothetical protein